MRIELTTSSLPRKCSTTELQQPINSDFALDTLFLVRCLSLGLITSTKNSRPWRAARHALPLSYNSLFKSVFALKTLLFLVRCLNLGAYHVSKRTNDLGAPCSTTELQQPS